MQRHIVALIRNVGGEVWEAGTKRSRKDHHMGTRQTPGIPDVMAFLPPRTRQRWVLLFVEAKASGGRLRPEQARFRELCQWADVAHVVGDLDAVIAWMLDEGYLKRDQVAHYRLDGVDPTARHKDDFYRTPAWMTRALLRRRPLEDWGGRHVEPCAGDGAIVSALDPRLDILTNDIVERGTFVPEFLLDATQPETWRAFARTGRLDVVLTNPPFDVTFEIAQLALEAASIGLVLLQRITWIEPTDDRGPWLAEHPPTRIIVLPRWNFRSLDGKGQQDSAPPAWFLWAKEPWFCEPGNEVVTKAERDELVALDRRHR